MKKTNVFSALILSLIMLFSCATLAACDKGVMGEFSDDVPPGGVEWTITLDPNGGTLTGGESVKTNENGYLAALPPSPTHETLDFKEWNTEKDGGGSKVTTTTRFSSDSTIYAQWKEKGSGDDDDDDDNGDNDGDVTYTVTFHGNGGFWGDASEKTVKTNAYGTIAALPEAPTHPEELTFKGYTIGTADSGSYIDSTNTFTQDTDVYAQWGSIVVGGDDKNAGLTYTACVGDGAWLVGVIQEKGRDWNTDGWGNGFVMTRADDENNKQYKLVVYLQSGDEVKIRYGESEGINYDQIENRAALSCIQESADGHNYSIQQSGYYTFYFKFNWDSNKIWIVYSATNPN